MAKSEGKKKAEKDTSTRSKLKTETKYGIKAVIFFVFALFFFLSRFGMAGVAGRFVYEKMHFLLGMGYLPLYFLYW
jgi:hypothetical protein